jgi:hypothetical protein
MVKILRVKPFGTQYGGSGPIKSAPGATANIKSGDRDVEQAAALLRNRIKAFRQVARTSIGSKGKL